MSLSSSQPDAVFHKDFCLQICTAIHKPTTLYGLSSYLLHGHGKINEKNHLNKMTSRVIYQSDFCGFVMIFIDGMLKKIFLKIHRYKIKVSLLS